jgi:nucleoid DNA-binding protein
LKLTEEPDLTRAEIIQILHDCLAISRKDAKHILERFLDIMAKGLGNGERVVLSGLGSFQVKPTPARPGRNPKTGKLANVPAKNRLSFAMSPSLRASMAEFIIQSRAAALPQYVPGEPGPWGTGPADAASAETGPEADADTGATEPDGPGAPDPGKATDDQA